MSEAHYRSLGCNGSTAPQARDLGGRQGLPLTGRRCACRSPVKPRHER